ncbi:MAG: branched-chain amino acid transport system ATP-binding protein livM [Actinomycetota bacterium]|jgi:branched-chain amino acid transport system permease protein|nr:branched-chain amino acid transport system ATP-binding protein livM [Actinomycetota bacterium]
MSAKLQGLMASKRARQIAAVAVAVAVGSIPLFGSHFTAFIFTLGVVYGLAAMSMSMLTGWVGQASLGHAAFAGAGAFATAKLQTHGWPFLAIMPVVVGAALLFSLVVGIPALRIRGLQLAVATLAFGYTAERGVFEQMGGGYSNDTVLHRPHAFGVDFLNDKNYYLLCVAIAVVLTALAANLRHRTMGRGMMAVRESETVFSHVGGNVASYKLAGFCISAVYAAIAGVLLGGLIANINKDLFNVQFGFYILAVAIVGGMGSLIGPYIAGLAFAWYPQMFAGVTALQYWTYMIGGLGMVFFVLLLPGGLVAIPKRVAELVRLLKGRSAKGPEDGAAVDTGEVEIDLRGTILAAPSQNGDSPATSIRTLAARSRAEVSLLDGETGSSRRMRGRHTNLNGSGGTLLEVEGVSISFGGTIALSDVSFSVQPREVHGLVGPNGAGKSTLFNCVTGIYRPSEARIFFKGTDLTGLPSYRRARLGIARTFQNINVLPNLTVLENLMVAEQAHWSGNLLRDALGLDSHHRQEKVRLAAEANLDFLGLAHLRDAVAGDLSHGTLKLVELARALTSEPEMLLLDEPAAGLSMQESERLGEVLRQLRDELQLTVLIVEHDMALVMANCNTVTVLDYGRVIASGPPDDVRNDPNVIAAYLGTTHEEVLAQ